MEVLWTWIVRAHQLFELFQRAIEGNGSKNHVLHSTESTVGDRKEANS